MRDARRLCAPELWVQVPELPAPPLRDDLAAVVDAMHKRCARQARTRALLREVNQRIAELGALAQAWSPAGIELLCECGEDGGCGDRVTLPPEVYEGLHAQDRFAVKPGHETLEVERAVEWCDGYVVVEKIPAAEPFVAYDPRGSPPA